MTKCLMRELENLARDPKASSIVKDTLKFAKNTIKLPCKHSGGICAPDECIKSFIGAKNDSKVFVGTQDEDLKNYLRNEVGTVPIFFMKNAILVMDSPSEVTEQKF